MANDYDWFAENQDEAIPNDICLKCNSKNIEVTAHPIYGKITYCQEFGCNWFQCFTFDWLERALLYKRHEIFIKNSILSYSFELRYGFEYQDGLIHFLVEKEGMFQAKCGIDFMLPLNTKLRLFMSENDNKCIKCRILYYGTHTCFKSQKRLSDWLENENVA